MSDEFDEKTDNSEKLGSSSIISAASMAAQLQATKPQEPLLGQRELVQRGTVPQLLQSTLNRPKQPLVKLKAEKANQKVATKEITVSNSSSQSASQSTSRIVSVITIPGQNGQPPTYTATIKQYIPPLTRNPLYNGPPNTEYPYKGGRRKHTQRKRLKRCHSHKRVRK